MHEQTEQVREIICKGTLEQFQARMEEERLLSKHSERRLSKRICLTLYGPITRVGSSCWLVSNGANLSLAAHREGKRGIGIGSQGRFLALLPDMTLDDIAAKASEIGLDLCQALGVGQVCAAELPEQHIQVLFAVEGFRQPDLFWRWVDGLTNEMRRLGFECVETSVAHGGSQRTSCAQLSESQIQRLRADVLLVTATEVEVRAVLDVAKERLGAKCQTVHDRTNTYRDLGGIAGARTFMVRSEMSAGGPAGAMLTITDAINDLSPSAVILVGIAFGVNPEKQRIGDVLVSRQILDYSLQRVGTGAEEEMIVTPRGDRVSASARLLTRFENGQYDWKSAKVQFGLILSGPVLVDNVSYRDWLRKLEPEAIGGEMEGGGLYAVAQRKKVDWIVVKTVCDWADGTKDKNKQEYQTLAAKNAVEFVIHVMEQGGFVENTLSMMTDDLAVPGERLQPQEERLLQAVYNETMNDLQHERAYMDDAISRSLDLSRSSYYKLAKGLVARGYLTDVSHPSVNAQYYYLRLTEKGRSYCASTHSSAPMSLEFRPDVREGSETQGETGGVSLKAQDSPHREAQEFFEITDKNFDESSRPQKLLIQFTNRGRDETIHVKKVRFRGNSLGIPSRDYSRTYSKDSEGHYTIPFDPHKAEVAPGEDFLVELWLTAVWERKDIFCVAGKWGYLRLDVTYKGETIELFNSI